MWPRVNDRRLGSFSLKTNPKGRGQKAQETRDEISASEDRLDDWHGEFGSYDEWAALGPQPPYGTATFFDAHGRRCITQHDFARARDDRAFPLRYRWERTEPRKRQRRRTPTIW